MNNKQTINQIKAMLCLPNEVDNVDVIQQLKNVLKALEKKTRGKVSWQTRTALALALNSGKLDLSVPKITVFLREQEGEEVIHRCNIYKLLQANSAGLWGFAGDNFTGSNEEENKE